jgi:uncharacterized protein YbcV (DUF1398 family)
MPKIVKPVQEVEEVEEKKAVKPKKEKRHRAQTLYNKFVSEKWETVEGVAKEKMSKIAKLWSAEKLKIAKKSKKE